MLIRYENENWWKRFIAEAAAIAIDKGDMDDYIEYLVPGYYELNDDQKNEAMEANITKLILTSKHSSVIM